MAWVRAGALMMFLGVAIGAFGAHGLKNVLTEPLRAIFETGVKYHLIHGLALFVVAWRVSVSSSSYTTIAGWCFLTGIVLFSGSLYTLSITGIKAWGAVTPFGGLAFLAGWILLALG